VSLAKIIQWAGWIVAAVLAVLNFLSSNPPPSGP
jgi:hypothetical protein